MTHIEGEVIINRPVGEVFDVVADERNEPRYNPRLLWVEPILARADQTRHTVQGSNQDDGPARRDDRRVHRLRAPAAPRLIDAHAHDGDPR